MGQYDKLGDLLKDAIESGNIPSKQPPESKTSDINDEITLDSHKSPVFPDESMKLLAVLGFKENNCSTEDVKTAYRKLLKKYHPDNIPKYPEMQKTAAKKTQEIVEAYKKLSEYFE